MQKTQAVALFLRNYTSISSEYDFFLHKFAKKSQNLQKSRKISRTASSSAFSTSALAVVVTRCVLLRLFATADVPARWDTASSAVAATVDGAQWDQILKKVHFGIHVIFIF